MGSLAYQKARRDGELYSSKEAILNTLEVYIFNDNTIDADREHNILDNIWRQCGASYHEFAIRLHGRRAWCLLVFSPDNACWPHDVATKTKLAG